jgi:cell division protein FtsI/penicillin-binding protein 2
LAERITRVNEVWPIKGISFKSPLRSKLVTDVHGYGPLATWDGLVKSSNIFMVMLAERMGKQRVYDALNSFAFGKTTGIELPGEDPGLLRPYAKWSNSDLVSTAQGYSVMITPLQLARAFCTYANGGRLVQPRIVEGVLDASGNVVSLQKNQPLDMMPQVVDPMTAVEMKRVLSDVVVRGTARSARSATWNIFGKTGTAHSARGGQYNEENYTSSFIAAAPAESPRLVIAFIIHDPDKQYALSRGLKYYGGTIAAPGASRAMERSLAYLQVPASPDLQPPPPSISDVLVNFVKRDYDRKKPGPAAGH